MYKFSVKLNTFIAIAILLLLLNGCEETAPPPATSGAIPAAILSPPISTEPKVAGAFRIEPGGFDFGIIEPSSSHKVEAVIHNTGTQPMTFLKVSPSCACTTPMDLTKITIPPGESIPFDSTFKAPTEPGLKTAYIQIVFKHGAQQGHTKINLQGMVTMAVRAEPPFVEAREQVETGDIAVASMDGKSFKIITSGGKKPVYADGFNPKKDGLRSSYTIKWNIPARNTDNCSGMRLWWVIETDHPDCPILPMRVRHECTGGSHDISRRTRGWYFKEYIAQLGAIEAGKPVEAEILIPLFKKSNIKIQSVQSLSQNASAQLISSKTSEDGKSITCRVRFIAKKEYQGVLYSMVMFKSNTGNKEIAFIAKVIPPAK